MESLRKKSTLQGIAYSKVDPGPQVGLKDSWNSCSVESIVSLGSADDSLR